MSHLLLLILLPFIGGLIILLLDGLTSKVQKILAVFFSLLPLLLLMSQYGYWNGSQVNFPWIPTLGIYFRLSLDGLSLPFILLTAIVIPIALASIMPRGKISISLFYALILFLQGILFVLFSAQDLVLFTIAWEAMLLPLYFIINLWGGIYRQRAAMLFLIYMIAGSALFIAAVLMLYLTASASSFDMALLAQSAMQNPYALLLFFVFLLAFSVKTPLFPFHAWLPETYVEAPFAGSILLSALLSKAGIYGIARIGYGFFPNYMSEYSPWLIGLAIAGTLYGAIAAWTQNDYKRLIAYSSFSHVNFILVGLFVGGQIGMQGAILQSFNHGITITALFLVAKWLSQRIDSMRFDHTSGVAKNFPTLCWTTLFFVLASIALPGMNNFVGELIILYALFKSNPLAAAILALSVILSAIYMLRWIQKIYFEEPKNLQSIWPDIGKKELILATPLIILILAIGIYPKPLLEVIQLGLKGVTP